MTENLYKPEYCQMAIDIGREGGNVVTLACQLGVGRATIYNWCSGHPEFQNALEQMRLLSLNWTTNYIRNNLLENGKSRLNGLALSTYVWLMHKESPNSINSAVYLPPEYYDPNTSIERRRQILTIAYGTGQISSAQRQIESQVLAQEFEEKEGLRIKELLSEQHDANQISVSIVDQKERQQNLPEKLISDTISNPILEIDSHTSVHDSKVDMWQDSPNNE